MGGLNIDRLKESIRNEEGLILHVYKCPAGKRTIGYGWNIDARGLPDFIEFYLAEHGDITLEMAEWLLDTALSEAIAHTMKLFSSAAWEWLTQLRREVLVNMVYNLGSLTKWHNLIASIEQHDIPSCISSLKSSLWHRQLPERSNRLIKQFEKG